MKTILCALLSICMIASMNAQADTETVVSYPEKGDSEWHAYVGLFSGFASENGFTPVEETTTLYNIGFGVGFDYYLSSTWSLRGRLNFDPKGSKDDINDSKFNASYITVPLMANWHFGKRKRWYLHFGPYIGFLMSADIDGDDVKDDLHSTEIGSDIGIGVKIPVGNTMLFIESDGQNDFTEMSDFTDEGIYFVRSTLSVGIIF
ncbi:MAG: PorT family protein [Saprospiraceae bacterium]|nr:PorT family protein [Saprospiraceae bacterium]